jgi:hypothetical protein
VNNKVNKAVKQLTKEGVYVNTYHSASEAARQLGKNSHAAIATVCRGDYVKKKRACGRVDLIQPKTAYGFKWEYI